MNLHHFFYALHPTPKIGNGGGNFVRYGGAGDREFSEFKEFSDASVLKFLKFSKFIIIFIRTIFFSRVLVPRPTVPSSRERHRSRSVFRRREWHF